jgi:hypothetical protein
MQCSLLRPVLSTTDTAPGEVYQLSLAEAIPVRTVRLRRAPLTFKDMRLCVVRDLQDGVLGAHPVASAREALARIEALDLWPHYVEGWSGDWGRFLFALAPLLDDPQVVFGRPGVSAALRHREVAA